ncbi:TPM domain-containing protein [Salipaludibacillus sp. HK11]|uniref:TPM domain-containing protein n=1 Tax=Salipaludibacillus sp. HK11 TaxID=3394320 RepID=UPI0039FCC6E5
MKSKSFIRKFSIIMLFLLITATAFPVSAENNQKIYDYAELLTVEEQEELEQLSDQYSEERQTDITILTTNDSQGLDIVEFTGDFYDEMYDQSQANAVILTIDMESRDVYISGFYKGEEYVDDSRADLIRQKITSDLSEGYYYDAFHSYVELSHEYLDIEPGVNPDNIFLNLGFQLILSVIIAAIIVAMMLYRSSGRMTTSGGTYMDTSNSAVTNRRDTYVRKVVTKVKKPTSQNNSRGGGGITKGGHSHSGSRGKF